MFCIVIFCGLFLKCAKCNFVFLIFFFLLIFFSSFYLINLTDYLSVKCAGAGLHYRVCMYKDNNYFYTKQ